jgi:CheY-like chemotaxis protein
MDGQIAVKTAPSKGTTFTITIALPLDEKGEREPLPSADLAGVKTIIVDDVEFNRRIVVELLKGLGMEFSCHGSSIEALESMKSAAAQGTPFQIAVLDHQMPEMDGETLGCKIKTIPELQDTVLVMLTSVAQKGHANLFKEIGFSAYLTKPVRAVELVDTLSAVWGAKIKGDPIDLVTKFSLTESRALQASCPDEVDSARTRVLIAEDNVVNQKIAAKILRKLGCRVDIAANGVEAVEMTELCPYHLVFMDCQMPAMDGFDAGMDDFIKKPVSEKILHQRLERWVDGYAAPPVLQVAQ